MPHPVRDKSANVAALATSKFVPALMSPSPSQVALKEVRRSVRGGFEVLSVLIIELLVAFAWFPSRRPGVLVDILISLQRGRRAVGFLSFTAARWDGGIHLRQLN